MKRAAFTVLSVILLLTGCIVIRREECRESQSTGSIPTLMNQPQTSVGSSAENTETPAADISADETDRSTHLSAEPQVPPFDRAEPHEFSESAETNLTEIKEVASQLTNIDVFVAWLKTRTNVSDVAHQKLSWLTSNPPKQIVSFTLNDTTHRLVLTADIPVRVSTLSGAGNR